MTLNIALVGCGGMGFRHALGYAELQKALPGMVNLVAVRRFLKTRIVHTSKRL